MAGQVTVRAETASHLTWEYLMGIYTKTGTRRTLSTVTYTEISPGDPLVRIDEDLYELKPFHIVEDPKRTEGTMRVLAWAKNDEVRLSELKAKFPAAVVTGISPATGGTVGGTVVTLTGKNLDGVTSVTFGGTAGTALTYVDPTTIRVTTPAKSAGAVAVAVTNPGGTTTIASGFTYA